MPLKPIQCSYNHPNAMNNKTIKIFENCENNRNESTAFKLNTTNFMFVIELNVTLRAKLKTETDFHEKTYQYLKPYSK